MTENGAAACVVQIMVAEMRPMLQSPELKVPTEGYRGSGFFADLLGPTGGPAEATATIPQFILTAFHVVANAAPRESIHVVMPLAGRKEYPAHVIVAVPSIDFAVLALGAADAKSLASHTQCMPLGDDHVLQLGDTAQRLSVLGYPMGQENLKIMQCGFTGRQDGCLQTDGAINAGNSGGPVTFDGRAVGFVSSGLSPESATAVSWAIPITVVKAGFSHIVPRVRHFLRTAKAPPASLAWRFAKQPATEPEYERVMLQVDTVDSDRKEPRQPEWADGLDGYDGSDMTATGGGGHRGGASNVVLHPMTLGVRFQNGSEYLDTPECTGGVVARFVSQFSPLASQLTSGDRLCAFATGGHEYAIDRFGNVRVGWYPQPLSLTSVLMDVPWNATLDVRIWRRATRQAQWVRGVRLACTHRGGFLDHSLTYEPIPWVRVGGVLLQPLRGNHLDTFACLSASFLPTQLEENRVIVVHVEEGSVAQRDGVVRAGMILCYVDAQPIERLADVYRALEPGHIHTWRFYDDTRWEMQCPADCQLSASNTSASGSAGAAVLPAACLTLPVWLRV